MATISTLAFPGEFNFNGINVECSHLVWRYWHLDGLRDIPVILITRNPLDVLRSHLSMISTTTADNAAYNVLETFDRLEHSRRILHNFRVEDQMPDLARYFGTTPLESDKDIDRNPHNLGRVNIGLDALSPVFQRMMVVLGKRYGYEL